MRFEDMVYEFMQLYVAKELNSANGKLSGSDPIFAKNLGITVIKTLLLSSLVAPENLLQQHIKSILETFYPILRFQFLYALLWRQSYGKLRQPPPNTLAELEAFQLTVKEDSYLLDLYIQIELHTMRKLFLTVYVLRKTYAEAENDDVTL